MLKDWFRISRVLVLEINVILVVVGIIFLLDVYNHIYVTCLALSNFNMDYFTVTLSSWMNWVRALTLWAYILLAILGIRMANRPSVFKFAGYMLIGFILLLYFASITLTCFFYQSDLTISVDMLLQELWLSGKFDLVEIKFDCCGKTGVIDYVETVVNRTWTRNSCCGMDNCLGCRGIIREYLWSIQMEIARDNIIVFIVLCVGMLIMLLHYRDAEIVEDPYESESTDEDEPSTLKEQEHRRVISS